MKFVFIHGYMSNPEADWYPAIRAELEKLGHEVVVPAMPGHRHPDFKEWINIVGREVESANQPVVLVGHSLGTRAILSYLEKSDKSVEKVLLIAPPNGKWHKVDHSKIKGRPVTILHSQDDKIVSIDQGRELAKQIDAKLIEVDGHGHFTKPTDAELVKSTLLDLVGS